MRSVEDVMVKNVKVLKENDSMAKAREAMKNLKIRHLPVVSSKNGQFIGMISQKTILNAAFKIVSSKGADKLAAEEKALKVREVMEKDVTVADPTTPLTVAGHFFMKNKHVSLPVVENGKVLGIVTPSDFVKLSMALLESSASRAYLEEL